MQSIIIIQLIFSIGAPILVWFFAWKSYNRNKTHALNQTFGFIGLFVGIGYVLYGVYHFAIESPDLIILTMILSHVCYNTGFTFLLISIFIIEYSNFQSIPIIKWVYISIVWIFMNIGYVIFPPTLNFEALEEGLVDTITPLQTFLFTNLIRILLILYCTYKMQNIIKFSKEKQSHKRFNLYQKGNISLIIALIMNFIGGFGFHWMHAFGLIFMICGFILFNLGFKKHIVKPTEKETIIINKYPKATD